MHLTQLNDGTFEGDSKFDSQFKIENVLKKATFWVCFGLVFQLILEFCGNLKGFIICFFSENMGIADVMVVYIR